MFLYILLLLFSIEIADALESSGSSGLSDAQSQCQAALTGNLGVVKSEDISDESHLDRIIEVNTVEAIVDEFYRIRKPFMSSRQYSNRERSLAIQLVKAVKGNVTKAAKKLKLAPTTLRSWVLDYEDLNGV